ncbi:MAG: thioredoxin TrxC [Gemmatimonadetes bacterium]|nr:thioredoxin TrxC [Gemmatimonadota bacterium]
MEKNGGASRKGMVRCPFCARLNRVDLARVQHRPSCGECGRPILLDRPLAVTDADLQRVVTESEVPVLVDFYADWCGPCKTMAPVLDELARERAGDVLVLKLDTERNPRMTERYGIRGIPTLILFSQGREFTRQTGAVPRSRLDDLLASVPPGAASSRRSK